MDVGKGSAEFEIGDERAAFETFLRWLNADRGLAGEVFEKARIRLMKFFESRGCRDFEELTDETFRRVVQRIKDGLEIREGSPFAYLYGIAGNVLHEYWKSIEKTAAAMEEWRKTFGDRESRIGSDRAESARRREKTIDFLESCVDALPSDQRKLFLEYHLGEQPSKIENRNRLAGELAVPLNALRIRVHRIRERIEKCVSERLEAWRG